MSMLRPLTIRLHHLDNVVVAQAELEAGTKIPAENIICVDSIPFGHKIATAVIKKGEAVRKYGHIIGFAGCEIKPGQHVHIHNLEVKDFLPISHNSKNN